MKFNMSQSGRRTLYAFAMFIFVLSAPLLVLHAQGFRYDVKTKSIIRIGTLSVYSHPRSATIEIDGIPYGRRTPTSNIHLRSGTYRITARLDGYQPLIETVRISPMNNVTLNVTLLPNTVESRYEFDVPLLAATRSLSNSTLLTARSNTDGSYSIGIFDADRGTNNNISELHNTENDDIRLYASPHGRYLAILESKKLYVMEQLTGSIIWSDNDPAYVSVEWSADSDSTLYALAHDSLWTIDTHTLSSRVIASPGISSFALNGSVPWVIQRSSSASSMRSVTTAASPELSSPITLDPTVTDIVAMHEGRAIVTGLQRAYGVAVAPRSTTELATGAVSRAIIEQSRNVAAIIAHNEVWTVDLRTFESSFLLRQSNIRDIAWYPRREALFFVADDTIQLSDLENRTASSGGIGAASPVMELIVPDNHTLLVVEQRGIEIIALP